MESAHQKHHLKGGKVRKSNMEKFTLSSPPATAGDEIQRAYEELLHPQNPQQQIGAVEKLTSLALVSEESARICTKLLGSAMLQFKPKVPLRTKIIKYLPVIREKQNTIYYEVMTALLQDALTTKNNPTSLVQGVVLLSESADIFFPRSPSDTQVEQTDCLTRSTPQEFQTVILRAVVQGLLLLWEKSIRESSAVEAAASLQQIQQLVKSCTTYLQHLIKTSGSIQVVEDVSEAAKDILRELLVQLIAILNYSTCPLDLRVNCGQLVALLHTTLKHGGNRSEGQQCMDMKDLVKAVMSGEGQYLDLPVVAKLAIINGILCVTPPATLFTLHNGTCLGLEVIQAVLTPDCQSSDGIVTVSEIRVLKQWTLRTLEAVQSMKECTLEEYKYYLDLSSPLMLTLLDYLWMAWDHFLDSVKHSAKETFVNLLKIHLLIDEERSKHHCFGICKSFLKQLSIRKFRFSAVGCMVPFVGAHHLLKLYPNLPCSLLIYMKDPAVASYAAELITALFIQHHKEVTSDVWENIWLNSFIDLFSKDMQTFGFELLFKKLLFTSPDCLKTALTKLVQYSENPVSEKLCLLLMCVKIGRYSSQWLKHLHQKHSKDDCEFWKCLLPYHIIELCLFHRDESVQSAVFSLLCESPKSTELPEKHELNLILDFYIHSLASQNPPFRQHVVNSTKKLLQRIRAGTLAIKKLNKNNDRFTGTQMDKTQICILPHMEKSLQKDETLLISCSEGDKSMQMDKNTPVNKAIEFNKTVIEQAQFCRKLFALMLQNLNEGSNFPRRGASLSILELFNEILIKGCGEILGITELTHSETYIDTLFFMLADSFENNKIVALKLLQSSSILYSDDKKEKLKCFLSSVFSLASSCRPPDTMTAAYVLKYLSTQPVFVQLVKESASLCEVSEIFCTQEIMCRCLLHHLKEEVRVAQESLLKAATTGPMYGLLLCLKMLLSDVPNEDLLKYHEVWRDMIKEVLGICLMISELVAPVVRNSSPEGHLPMDLNPESLESLRCALQVSLGNNQEEVTLSENSGVDELVKAQAVSAQMLLLCAWRSVKEVSLILGNLVQELPLSPNTEALLSIQDVIKVGQYFLTQLLETKHRGAFEQSYVGLGRVCERLWQCADDQLSRLPEKWLTEVLMSIQNHDDTRLCATRRSAGVPFIVQAVLSSEPSIRGAACLKTTMVTLLAVAREEEYNGTDTRIHSFNILRSIYRDARLGDFVIPYVSEGVKSAIIGYKSTLWAERNAATLLFAALMTRMLGVKQTQDDLSRKNSMSALVFFRRYPDLFDFLREELEAGAAGMLDGRLVPALFPVLLLLARLAPAPLEGRTSSVSLTVFTPAILQCASSSVFQLRTLASHALIPLVSPCHLQSIVKQLCVGASLAQQNALHGTLMCLSKLMKNYHECNTLCDMNGIIDNILTISWSATSSNACLVTRSCALDLFTFLLTQNLIPFTSLKLKSISQDALSLIQGRDPLLWNTPWETLCQKQAAVFLLVSPLTEESGDWRLSRYLMNSCCYEVRQCVLENIDKLPDEPDEILKLLHERMNAEENMECLMLVYKNLTQLLHQQKLWSNLLKDSLKDIFKITISQANEETCPELRDAAIQLSSAAVGILLSMTPRGDTEPLLRIWISVMKKLSGSEHCDGTRMAVAESVVAVLPHLPSHLSATDLELQLVEVALFELHDDFSMVREVVAEGVTRWLSYHHSNAHPCLHPTRVLTKLCRVVGNMGTPDALSVLVTLVLKEDVPQGFGLTQDDDRVFDKGEMNVYSESLLIGRTSASSLASVLSSWPEQTQPPVFLKQSVIPYMHMLRGDESNSIPTSKQSDPNECAQNSVHQNAIFSPKQSRITDDYEHNEVEPGKISAPNKIVVPIILGMDSGSFSKWSEFYVCRQSIDKLRTNSTVNNQELSVAQLLSLLEGEIVYTYNQISSVTSKALYCVKNSNVWLVRLACRSALWRALMKYCYVESPNLHSVVGGLQNSMLKVNLIQEIINDLRESVNQGAE